jgi:hypothetical protein
MFRVATVPVLVRKIGLTIEENDDEESDESTVRACTTTFRIKLLARDLAEAIIGVPVARHCFGKDGLPVWDVNDVRFTPPEAHYAVDLYSAPDMPEAVAILQDATIDTIRVWRPKDTLRDLALEFTTRHVIARGDVKDLGDLITAWEHRVAYVTLTEIRPPLFEDLDAPDPPAPTRRARAASSAASKTH